LLGSNEFIAHGQRRAVSIAAGLIILMSGKSGRVTMEAPMQRSVASMNISTFRRLCAIAVACAFVHVNAIAQNATPAPGEYQVDYGWGTLTVKPGATKDAQFKITAQGANGHSCEIEGAIRNGIADVDTGDKGKACRVGFTVTAAGIDVKPLTSEECRYFCGARASFDGLYAKAVPGCEDATRLQARNRFKKLYDTKQYQNARATLEPLLTTCAKSLIWYEDGSIRNDLAITQYHLHDYNGCLDTLKAFNGDDATQHLENLKATEPGSADLYAEILGPARHNIALCAKAVRQ
jgi:hypothetical protein